MRLPICFQIERGVRTSARLMSLPVGSCERGQRSGCTVHRKGPSPLWERAWALLPRLQAATYSSALAASGRGG